MISSSDLERRDNPEFPGWTLGEATRRTTSPSLLKEWISADRAWRGVGRPRRLQRDNEATEVNQARLCNEDAGALVQVQQRQKNASLKIQTELQQLLASSRLVGIGRPGSALAAPQLIPASAWKHIRVRDIKASVAEEKGSPKTKIYDVRIFPLIESPRAVAQLADMTLRDAFIRYVFYDPQVLALTRRARSLGCLPFRLGFDPRILSAMWPASFAARCIWTSDLEDQPDTLAHKVARTANRVLGRRFETLISFLKQGALEGESLCQDGVVQNVPGSWWARSNTHLNLVTGDIVEYNSEGGRADAEFSSPLYVDVMLRRGQTAASRFHVKPLNRDVLPPRTIIEQSASQKPVSGHRVLSPHQESVKAAVAAIWPDGIPPALTVKRRDAAIANKQRELLMPVTSIKTIQRYLKQRRH